MKTSGVIIDSWKLPIFERHLKEGGYTFEKSDWQVADTLLLRVNAASMQVLARVLLAASQEADREKQNAYRHCNRK